jgi:hypothetical protein
MSPTFKLGIKKKHLQESIEAMDIAELLQNTQFNEGKR